MKIEINLYDETGERVVGKAIETDCQSLIINGMHVIQAGGVNAEMRQLEAAAEYKTTSIRTVVQSTP